MCVVLAPGMGDGIQAAKAGLLEIGDIYLVNKSDREGAEQTKVDIEKSIAMSALIRNNSFSWTPPVLLGSMQQDLGVTDLILQIENHRKASNLEN